MRPCCEIALTRYYTDQPLDLLTKLGAESNALVWPADSVDEDEEVDELENPINQRLMRIGDDVSDLELSDLGSVTDSESESDFGSSENDDHLEINAASSTTSLPLSSTTNLVDKADSAAISEFHHEAIQSLERAFSEGHSVDNASVELKTLRMASNVPLRLVREAVIGFIVDRIKVVPGSGPDQRKEIATMVGRWGGLVDRIGGVDAVETVEILQSHCASSERLPLFGQILAAFYQDDIVEEDDIREWHSQPASRGDDVDAGLKDNFKKCWTVGAHMIKQFDEQESEESDEDEDEEDEED